MPSLARAAARLATRRPLAVALAALLPAAAALVALLAARAVVVHNPSLSDYFVRADARTRLHDARAAAIRRFAVPAARGLSLRVERARPRPNLSLALVFSPLRNVSAPALAALRAAEDAVLADPAWPRFCRFDPLASGCARPRTDCVMPRSPLNSPLLYGVYDERGRLCARRPASHVVQPAQLAEFLEHVRTGRVNADLKLVDAGRAADGPFSMRALFPVGSPFRGFAAPDDRPHAQTAAYEAWVTRLSRRIAHARAPTPTTRTFLFSVHLARLRFGREVARDLVFAPPAVALVLLVICLHTRSLFLAVVALAQIFLSFPLAYVVYTFVFQQRYFSALQVFGIFLLLGIGADDVFVFTDAWKQAPLALGPRSHLLFDRLLWTYRRAAKAILVTSLTTAVAFFVTATSPIMPMSTFGVWAGILILVQFLLVVTVYPCALVLWQRHFRGRSCFYPCRPQADASDAQRADSIPIWLRCVPSKAWRAKLLERRQRSDDERPRLLERFFHGPWTTLLHRLRFLLLFLAAAAIAVSVFLATRLEPPAHEEQLLPSDHPVIVASDLLRTNFSAVEDGKLLVRITWGIRDIDRTGTSRFNPSDLGTPILDRTFDLKAEATQRHIMNVCRSLESNTRLVSTALPPQKRVRCWMYDFVAWKRKKARSDFEEYRSDASLLFDLLDFGLHSENGTRPYQKYITEQDIMVSNAISYAVSSEIRAVSPNNTNLPHQEMWKVYQAWEAELAKQNKQAPSTAGRAIVTAGQPWLWQITQRTLASSLRRNIGIMLVVTSATLSMTTLNLLTSFLATVCLGGIVVSLLGILYLIGWNLGVTESIIAVLSVGYSFDGIAHIAAAYSQSAATDRHTRTQDALTTLGISIVFGALSTACSSAMLLPATVLLFSKLATLILITVALTLVWSLAMLPAALLVFGPQGEFMSLKPLLRRIVPKKAHALSPTASSGDISPKAKESETVADDEHDSCVSADKPG